MSNVQVKLNLEGVRQILSCDAVRDLLEEKTEAIAAEANHQSANYQVKDKKYYDAERFTAEVDTHDRSHGIAVGHVWANGIYGRIACAKGTPLMNALDAGR